jgi:hypothetical protein
MGRGIFKKLLNSLEEAGARLPDSRRAGHNFRHTPSDALKCAFAVFFFQHPSLPDFQRRVRERRRRDNMQSIFGVRDIPSDTRIKTLTDRTDPDRFGEAFGDGLRTAEENRVPDEHRVPDGGVLPAPDGVWYHSSENIHCRRRLHKTGKDGVTTYYHTIPAAAIVKPGGTAVLPVTGELIRNEDGAEKRDCERNAAKRWPDKHAQEYQRLGPALLGDDLFSNYPLCKKIVECGYSFIFTCKEDSRKRLAETVKNSYLEEYTRRERNGRRHSVYRHRRLNGVEIRDSRETLPVNYTELEITNEEKKKVIYRNSRVTDKAVSKDNAAPPPSCGKARRKTENEHNNALKNHGYNLEHNFGHGEEHAGGIFCLLNLPAFLFHTVSGPADEAYQKARPAARRRAEFFNCPRAGLRYAVHENLERFPAYASEPGG